MEPTEMQEFSKQLEEAGQDAAKSGGEESLTRISLAISILAVLVAMVTVLGHRTHTEAILMQSRAGDTWNEYQAKSIRSETDETAKRELELDDRFNQPGANRAEVDQQLAKYAARLDKWKVELPELQEKAREFEVEVDHAERRADRYDLGEALLQIAVVVCSITLFTRRRSYFVLGLAMGLAGVLVSASALLVH